jgi:hypothetical protein
MTQKYKFTISYEHKNGNFLAHNISIENKRSGEIINFSFGSTHLKTNTFETNEMFWSKVQRTQQDIRNVLDYISAYKPIKYCSIRGNVNFDYFKVHNIKDIKATSLHHFIFWCLGEDSAYIADGYSSRIEYLSSLAESYDVDLKSLCQISSFLGADEDFDGLIVELENGNIQNCLIGFDTVDRIFNNEK